MRVWWVDWQTGHLFVASLPDWLAYLTSISLPVRIQDHALVAVVLACSSRGMCFFQVLISLLDYLHQSILLTIIWVLINSGSDTAKSLWGGSLQYKYIQYSFITTYTKMRRFLERLN